MRRIGFRFIFRFPGSAQDLCLHESQCKAMIPTTPEIAGIEISRFGKIVVRPTV